MELLASCVATKYHVEVETRLKFLELQFESCVATPWDNSRDVGQSHRR